MKFKKTVILIVSLMLVFSLTTFAKTKKLRRVNVYPLVKGGVADVSALKTAVDTHAKDIEIAFDKAGAAFLYPAFMQQVKTADIKEQVIPKGQKMQWMLFRAGGKAKAVKDVQWDGKKTLEVFALNVNLDCKDYVMIVPKACGNIALVEALNSIATCDMKVSPEKANIGDKIKVDMSGSKCATKYLIKVYHPEGTLIDKKELTAGNDQWETSFKEPGDYFIKAEAFNADGVASSNSCEAKVYINFPPKCDLKVSPNRSYTGKPFKLDASGSTDQDGKVVKAAFKITKDGQEVDVKTVEDKLIWEKIFKKSGIYKVSVKVTDDFNAESSNDCQASLEVQKRLYMLVEGGPMVAKGTYSGYVFARAGIAYLLAPEKWSLVVSAGGGITLNGDPFKSHFMSNILLNAHFGQVYVGGGFGLSSKVREDWNSDVDIVTNFGINIIDGFNKKGSIFGELRIPMKKGLEFKHAHEILLGFRYLF